MLICPRCLPEEDRLQETIFEAGPEEITEGYANLPPMPLRVPDSAGDCLFKPEPLGSVQGPEIRYQTLPVLSSYLWSHYGDLLGDEQATDAYSRWAGLMHPSSGVCLDTGSAVGRFSFDMAKKFDFVVGIDNSVAFIRASRELMSRRQADLALLEEGGAHPAGDPDLPRRLEDGQYRIHCRRRPGAPLSVRNIFRSGLFERCRQSSQTSEPSGGNRSCGRNQPGPIPVSDPFSWSTEAAPAEDWLGASPMALLPAGARTTSSPCWKAKLGPYLPAGRSSHKATSGGRFEPIAIILK